LTLSLLPGKKKAYPAHFFRRKRAEENPGRAVSGMTTVKEDSAKTVEKETKKRRLLPLKIKRR